MQYEQTMDFSKKKKVHFFTESRFTKKKTPSTVAPTILQKTFLLSFV